MFSLDLMVWPHSWLCPSESSSKQASIITTDDRGSHMVLYDSVVSSANWTHRPLMIAFSLGDWQSRLHFHIPPLTASVWNKIVHSQIKVTQWDRSGQGGIMGNETSVLCLQCWDCYKKIYRKKYNYPVQIQRSVAVHWLYRNTVIDYYWDSYRDKS